MKQCIALLLSLALLLTGCAAAPAAPKTENLAENTPARVVCLGEIPDCAESVTDISLKLFQKSHREGENTLLSPLSVLAALGMTANGADGETLAQITDSLGLTREELDAWIYSYLDADDSLRLANSLWIRDDGSLQVEPSFLEANADFYQADVFKTPFTGETLSQINSWVADKTENRIPQILDSIPEEAMLYLINALTFEADWEDPYEPYQVIDGTFRTEAGVEQKVSFMNSTESAYLETDLATGFLKYYKDRNYAFAALLPGEGITVSELLNSLNGETLHVLLSAPRDAVVKASLPKFETEYSAELSDVLKELGITDAFDPGEADFSCLGKNDAGNLYISQVRHKTAITVAEEGTKAAAATIVEMLAGAAFQPDLKFVTLDRPFVYLLIDCRENVPFFIGTVMDMSAAAPEAPARETEPPAPEAPHRLNVELDGENLTLDAGNYDWSIQDGPVTNTILACGAAPMDYAGEVPMITTSAAAAELSWPWNAPDSLSVTLWDPETGETTALSPDGNSLDLTNLSGIFQINARWDSFGSAEYILTLARP